MQILPFILLALCSSTAAALASPADAPTTRGDTQTFTSGSGRAALVELYTSEGCSSCPPTEAWLSRLMTDPQIWRTVVPVAFHVDYWDRLGWRDRFASAAATDRQRSYAQTWGSNSVYTPELVLNGQEWRPAPGEPPSNATTQAAGTGPLRAVVTNGRTVQVTYRPDEHGTAPSVAAVALHGSGLDSQVRAGENQGRSLHHDFVALNFQTQALTVNGPERNATFELPAALPGAKRLALAVWVQSSTNGAVQQATGGWLAAPPPRPAS